MRHILTATLFFIVTLLTTNTFGQSYSGSASGRVRIYSVQYLKVSSNKGVLNLGKPLDFVKGLLSEGYTSISIKSNSDWVLSFSAQNSLFTALSLFASKNMPADVVSLKIKGSSTNNYQQLSTKSQTIRTGPKGSGTSQHDFDIDVNFNPGYKYNGGLYSIGVVFTLSKP